jgi:hypothetical protein
MEKGPGGLTGNAEEQRWSNAPANLEARRVPTSDYQKVVESFNRIMQEISGQFEPSLY